MEEKLAWALDPKNKKDLEDLKEKRRSKSSTVEVNGIKMPRSTWLRKQLSDLGLSYKNSKRNLKVAEMEEILAWAQDPENKKALLLKKSKRKFKKKTVSQKRKQRR